MQQSIFIPLKIVSEANLREHWRISYKRHKDQKNVVSFELIVRYVPRKLPVTVTLTRVSPRTLDDDNLLTSLKYIRDAIAEYFVPGLQPGRADNDNRITWKYSQDKSVHKGVRLTFDYPDDD